MHLPTYPHYWQFWRCMSGASGGMTMGLPNWIQLLICPDRMFLTCFNGGHIIGPGDTFAYIDDGEPVYGPDGVLDHLTSEPMCRECLSMFNE